MKTTLNGLFILVTRPAHQADYLCSLIERYGGIAVRYPTLEIVGIDQQNFATFPANRLSKFQWIIFTSANAVNFALQGNSGKIRQFVINVAAIGKATAKVLESSGLTVNLIPENGYNSEALLAMPQMQQVNGSKILIVRGQGGREELAKALTNRGAIVEYLEVYQRVIPDHDSTEVHALLREHNLSAVVVTSGEALENMLTMIGFEYLDALKSIPMVVISDRILQLAVTKGFGRVLVADNPSDAAIVNALMTV